MARGAEMTEGVMEGVTEQWTGAAGDDQGGASVPSAHGDLFDMGLREAMRAITGSSLLGRFRHSSVERLHEVLGAGDHAALSDLILDMAGGAMTCMTVARDKRLHGLDTARAMQMSGLLLRMVCLSVGDRFQGDEGALLRLEAIIATLRHWVINGEGSEMLVQTAHLMESADARLGVASPLVMPLAVSRSVLRARASGFNFAG